MKSTTLKNPRNNRAQACTADRLSTRKSAPACTGWSLYIGLIKLTILGPEDHQWFSVSKSSYGLTVGTPMERDIANRAVAILNREHPNDSTISRPQIDAIIARATAEHAASTPQPD